MRVCVLYNCCISNVTDKLAAKQHEADIKDGKANTPISSLQSLKLRPSLKLHPTPLQPFTDDEDGNATVPTDFVIPVSPVLT